MKKRIISLTLIFTMLIAFIPFSQLGFTANAAVVSRDNYQSTYGVSYKDLFRKYPSFLQHTGYIDYFGYIDSQLSAVDSEFGGADLSIRSYYTALKEGVSFPFVEIAAMLGVGDTYSEQRLDNVTLDFVKEYMSSETPLLEETANEVVKEYKKVNKLYNLSSTIERDAFISEIKAADSHFTDKQIDDMADAMFKDYDDLFKDLKTAQECCEFFLTFIELNRIDRTIINTLIRTQEIKDSSLYTGLIRLSNKRNQNFKAYFADYYLSDSVKSIVKKAIKSTILGSPEAMLITSMIQVADFLFKPVTSDKYIEFVHARSFISSCSTNVTSKQIYLRSNYATDSDIEDYEKIFSSYITAYKVALTKAIQIKKNKNVDQLKQSLDSLNQQSYNSYINACLAKLSAAIQNGLVPAPENRPVIGKDPAVVKDNTQTILSRFRAIQEKYPPNVNATFTDDWGGAIQCFGFVRMVFSKLFGCEMPYAYMNSYRYKYVDNSNVVLIGQLEEGDVTVDNLKRLLSQAKLGDVIQASGVTQHTMMVVSVNDTGVEVYDANWKTSADQPDCAINQHWISYEFLAGRYNQHNDYSAAGFSLYRAANYSDISGDGSYVFYDDSVNFEIDNGVLIKYHGWQSNVEIPDTVTEIGAYAFSGNKYIRSVFIPDSVTSIGDNAFDNCINLYRVTMPNSLEKVAYRTFANCFALAFISIPDDVKLIERDAFYECSSLRNINLPKSLEILGSGAFQKSAVESIEIPKSLDSVDWWTDGYGTGAFANCDNLKTVTFEDGTLKVAHALFGECTGLEEITIPNTVTKIESWAFRMCPNLKSVSISDSVTEIESDAFEKCTSLESIEIPDSITTVGSDAFNDCTALKEIKLSKSLETLGSGAFQKCAVESIEIPKSLDSVDWWTDGYGTGAFANCDSLKTVTFEDGTPKVAHALFGECTGLEEITIPDSVTIIESWAFRMCPNLKSVSIPDSVTEIESDAFEKCTSLESIEIPDSVTAIGSGAFNDCTSLTRVVLSKNLKDLPTFRNCTSLKEVEFFKGITYIVNSSFINCTSLESIVMPEGVKVIENNAFNNCKSLASVSLPQSLERIQQKAFYECKALQEILIPKNTKSIGNQSFYNCKALTKVEISDSVTSIGESAFEKCETLTDITLSKNVQTIEKSTFRGCSALTEVIIPEGVKEIKEYAFAEDVKLADVSIPQSVTKIASNAFSYPKKMTIHGYAGSYAQEYAASKGIAFEEVKPYSITYDANGGAGAPSSQEKMPGENITLSVDKPVKDGYVFAGWALRKDATEAAYQAGDKFTENADTTLYAVWSEIILSSISIKNLPSKTTYEVNETLDTTGLVLTANYNDGSTEDIMEGFACTPTTLDIIGQQEITVTYEGLTAVFEVTVDNVVTSVSIQSTPDKTVYTVGDTLDTSGLILTVNYSDKSSKEISNDFTCTPTVLNTVGKQTITVAYGDKTATFDVTVNSSLEITTQPSDAVVAKDAIASFKVVATGDGLTYQWQLSDDQGKTWRNSKATTACYSATVTDSNNGRYVRCVVTDKYGNQVTSNSASISLAATKLTITSQPASATVKNGATASFKVAATGDGLTYQWQLSDDQGKTWRNSKATTANYSATVTDSNNGRYVRCIVTDKYGNKVTSNAAFMKITTLKITTQPASATVKNGATASFKVAATGDGLTYQWQLSDDQGKTWRNSKATTASYSATVTDSNNGRYVRCIVTDKYGNKVTSNAAYMKITSLKITTQPASATVKNGATASFKVVATGPSITYQWQLSDDQSKTWRDSSNKTATYSTTLSDKNNGRYVRCVVTDKYGNSLKSNAAYMKITSLKITTQPASATVKNGATASFKVVATGPSITYQWQLSDDQGKTWRNSKATTANYSATVTDSNNGRYVRCIVTDKYGNSVKSNATYMKITSLKITSQPVNAKAAKGGTVTFKVVATGPSITYQWQLSDDQGKTWRDSSNKTATYSTTLSDKNNGRYVRCVVTDKYGNSVKSNAAVMKIK